MLSLLTTVFINFVRGQSTFVYLTTNEEIIKAGARLGEKEKQPGFVHYTGEYYMGGIVFRVWKTGETEHGLIAAMSDVAKNKNWNVSDSLCNAYSVDSFTNWRLPTKEELDFLCQFNKKMQPVLFRVGSGNTRFLQGNYWSSTRYEMDTIGDSVWCEIIYAIHETYDCYKAGATKTEPNQSARPIIEY